MNLTKKELLEEIQQMEENTIKYPNKYAPFSYLKGVNEINVNCLNCKKHDRITYKDVTYHICFDDWSGIGEGGWHVIYSETLDLCAEMGGFKSE